MKQIRFSVVIPTFNAAETVVASVNSCVNQSLPPFEIIVIDDGSSDETVSILEKQFPEKIKLIKLTENGGPARARNVGIKAADGHYIAFQDADDIWHPEKLRIINEIILANPGIKFLFHPFTLSSKKIVIAPTLTVVKPYPFWKLLFRNPIGTPCAILARHENLAFNEKFHYMEDYELFLREADRTGVYHIAAPLTKLGRPVLSPGGQSSNRWAMRKGEILAWWAFVKTKPKYFTAAVALTGFSLIKHLIKSVSVKGDIYRED